MTPHPEVEVIVIIRQMRGSQGMAIARGHASLLTDTPVPELVETVLTPAFLEAMHKAGFQPKLTPPPGGTR